MNKICFCLNLRNFHFIRVMNLCFKTILQLVEIISFICQNVRMEYESWLVIVSNRNITEIYFSTGTENLSHILILAFMVYLCRKVHCKIDLFPITLDVDIVWILKFLHAIQNSVSFLHWCSIYWIAIIFLNEQNHYFLFFSFKYYSKHSVKGDKDK